MNKNNKLGFVKEIKSKEENKTFIKQVQVGGTWNDVEVEYEEIDNCAIEKGGGYLAFVRQGAVIPDYIKTIGRRAFGMSGVKNIVFPSSVEEIEEDGCSNCDSLESVTLNEGLKKIGRWAFRETSIRQLRIPSSVEDISGGAFQNIEITVDARNKKYEVIGNCLIDKTTMKLVCGTNKSVIPEGIKIIDDWAFYDTDIKSIRIPSSVEKIGDFAFFSSKLEKLELNEGLCTIGERAFSETQIKRVNIPSTVKEIREASFCDVVFTVALENTNYESSGNCLIEKKIQKLILGGKKSKIPRSVKQIGARAFESSTLKSIVIPKNVQVIEKFAFENCVNLEYVELKEGLKKIERSAFEGIKIKSIVIPSSVVEMDEMIIGFCDELEILYCKIESKPDGWNDNWNIKEFGEERYKVIWGYKGKQH